MSAELRARLERVRAAIRRSPDPLADPLALDFEPRSGRWQRENWQRFVTAAREGRVHDRVVLYVHLPFCAKICSYCLLSAQRPESKQSLARYVEAVVRELRRHGELFEGVPIAALHVGGGTPTLLSAPDLDRILGEAERAFARTPDFVADLESHPTTTTEEKLAVAARRGIRRVSFGVESFTPRVLELVNRSDQTRERLVSAVESAKRAGLSVNVDLLAGLPGETLESFEESLKLALDLGADALSVNRYLSEGSPLADAGYVPSDDAIALASAMLRRADEVIRAEARPLYPPPGPEPPLWGTQYLFVHEGERGYSQQDMIDPGSVLAIGHGGMGRIHAGYHFIAAGDVGSYTSAVLAGEAPDVLACLSDLRFEMAFFVTERASRGGIDDASFRSIFRRSLGSVFGAELAFLSSEGLLQERDGSYRKPARRDFDSTQFLAFLADRGTARIALPSAPSPTDEYSRVGAELPPALIWCRLAMRAARASRRRMAP
ncbi:MAG: radical SAM protein [Myxococcales bacterium]|nr:radical SAM protein [Myxococcales bacterium]